MGITRARLSFENDFTQVPNAWVRDKALSRRARGLLVEIMSHRPGWHITLRSLAQNGPEGRDALRTAIAELRAHGYLAMVQQRGDGNRFGEVEYVLQDPAAAADGKSVSGDQAADGSSGVGFSADGESDPKNTIPTEDHPEEHQNQDSPRSGLEVDARKVHDDGSYSQSVDHLVDIPRVIAHLAGSCGRTVEPVVAFAIIATILERAKVYPNNATRYVLTSITRDPIGWQQFIDSDGSKKP